MFAPPSSGSATHRCTFDQEGWYPLANSHHSCGDNLFFVFGLLYDATAAAIHSVQLEQWGQLRSFSNRRSPYLQLMVGQSIVDGLLPGPVGLHKAVVLVGRLLEVRTQVPDTLLQLQDLFPLFLDHLLLCIQLHPLFPEHPKL